MFTTDFRIWTFAFKTFEPSAIPAAVKYMPFFFVYYLVSGSAAVSNTSSEKLQGVSEQWEIKTVWGVGYKFELQEGAFSGKE